MAHSPYPVIPNIELPDWQQLHQIAIVESSEVLVPISLASKRIQVEPAYLKMSIPQAMSQCFLRFGVYQRLQQAATQLPDGITLVALDGWRPVAVQHNLFNNLLNQMVHTHPEQDAKQQHATARNFVAPPSTSVTAPSPHLTGGAIDVTLADKNGNLLDMATEFDEVSPLSYTASLELITTPSAAQQVSIINRRMLYSVMINSGFTNLPSEWWHFDFGDQLWAWYSGSSEAIYGATEPVT